MTAEPPMSYALDVSVTADRMQRKRVAFPWSLGRAYACETWTGALRLIPQVSGAGLLSGDHLRQKVHVDAQARLRLESAGAMQVLAGTSGVARSDWNFVLEHGAMLVLDAEPYALMPRAALDLHSHFHLAPEAIVLAAEAICYTHMDIAQHPHGLGTWRSQTTVADASGASMFIDRQAASIEGVKRLRRLPTGFAAFGTIWVLADIKIAEAAVVDLPDVTPCRLALSPLRAGAGIAIRLAAVDGGVLRFACRLLMNVLEPRLAEAQSQATPQANTADQAARSLADPAMVAQS